VSSAQFGCLLRRAPTDGEAVSVLNRAELDVSIICYRELALQRTGVFCGGDVSDAERSQRLGARVAARFALLEVDFRNAVMEMLPWKSAVCRKVASCANEDAAISVWECDKDGLGEMAAGAHL